MASLKTRQGRIDLFEQAQFAPRLREQGLDLIVVSDPTGVIVPRFAEEFVRFLAVCGRLAH